ncbi:MAG: hypothetical protein WB814_15535 [Candidatus Sulfotelmatobacter sp.]
MKRECNNAIFRRVEAECGASSINMIWLQPDLNTAASSLFPIAGTPRFGAQYHTVFTEMKTIAMI